MFEPLRRGVLYCLRVPPAPEPPSGAPESVRIFRAGRNHYKLQLLRWAVAQAGAIVGILFSLTFLGWFKAEVEAMQREVLLRTTVVATPAPNATPAPSAAPSAPAGQVRPRPRRSNGLSRQDFRYLAQHTPQWVIVVMEIFEAGGILLFLAQLPVTYAAVRLEFELHWYIVTDRSLRIRIGLFRLRESTMSFANLQQVEVKQGPLQRLLGLADLRVESAGGGTHRDDRPGRESLHTGVFHSVENAAEIRDLILDRLRKFREAGLGDPDDQTASFVGADSAADPHGRSKPAPRPEGVGPSNDALAAAQELLAEARALRQELA